MDQQYKLILASGNRDLGLKRDLFVDIVRNPGEKGDQRSSDSLAMRRLLQVVEAGDAIVPSHEELPYGYGRKGFVPPKEWKPTR